MIFLVLLTYVYYDERFKQRKNWDVCSEVEPDEAASVERHSVQCLMGKEQLRGNRKEKWIKTYPGTYEIVCRDDYINKVRKIEEHMKIHTKKETATNNNRNKFWTKKNRTE